MYAVVKGIAPLSTACTLTLSPLGCELIIRRSLFVAVMTHIEIDVGYTDSDPFALTAVYCAEKDNFLIYYQTCRRFCRFDSRNVQIVVMSITVHLHRMRLVQS